MTDILERLLNFSLGSSGAMRMDAAAEIEHLRFEIERLRRELKLEKEESASYHKFWIEARDAMHKLAEKDA